MSINDIIAWYDKNVNYKLTKPFLNSLIKIGIIKENVDLDLLNLFLLEKNENEFVKINNKFKIKENRKAIISKYKDEAKPKQAPKPVKQVKQQKPKPKVEKKVNKNTEAKETVKRPIKFRIESLGGSKLKLVKI